jgi:hypothetical protein
MREKVYSELLNSNEYAIVDSTTCDWSTFSWDNGWYEYRVTQADLLKSYFISYKYYQTVDYEDIILLLNNIGDPFEMVVGSLIKVPKLNDVKAFILTNSK